MHEESRLVASSSTVNTDTEVKGALKGKWLTPSPLLPCEGHTVLPSISPLHSPSYKMGKSTVSRGTAGLMEHGRAGDCHRSQNPQVHSQPFNAEDSTQSTPTAVLAGVQIQLPLSKEFTPTPSGGLSRGMAKRSGHLLQVIRKEARGLEPKRLEDLGTWGTK